MTTTPRTLRCPRCRAEFQAESVASGRRVLTHCPSCGRDMVIDGQAAPDAGSSAPFPSPLAAAGVLLALTLVGIALAWPWREARRPPKPPVVSAPARTEQPTPRSVPADTADAADAADTAKVENQADVAAAARDAERDEAPIPFPDPARRPDAAAEAALREAATAQEVMMGDSMTYGVSAAGVLPGAAAEDGGFGLGGVRVGAELLGPMRPAEARERGAFLFARDRKGKPRGQGFALPAGVFLRADAIRSGDSHIVYARHRDSGRAFAWDADGVEPWICENADWKGESGIMARFVSVTSGKNDLADQDCGGRQIPRWTRLSAVNPARNPDESAEAAVRNFRTANEVLVGDYRLYGASAEGLLPPFQPVLGDAERRVRVRPGGRGAELLGPLEAASETSSGAYLVARDKNGVPHGLGMGIAGAVYVRVDVSADRDGAVHYARHSGSGRVFAADSDDTAIHVCENGDWADESGILARPVEVTPGKNDLEGQDCGGKEIPRWTNLSLVRGE